MMINKGIIAVNKPKDWTSFDVVNKIKHLLKIKRVGHLGTLDPMATGVLLVTVGKATKLFDYFQNKNKTYLAKFEFGYETDTLDITGKITKKTDTLPSIGDIKKLINKFIGEIEQVPPKYSAKNINGKRAYQLARNNEEFELKPKLVKIDDIKIVDYSNNILTVIISCGSGTYIRSICRDLAEKLNSYATMIELVRTDVGRINLKNCVNIQELDESNIRNYIIKLDKMLDIPIFSNNSQTTSKLLNGQIIDTEYNDGLYKLNDSMDTIAIINVKNNRAKMSIFLD